MFKRRSSEIPLPTDVDWSKRVDPSAYIGSQILQFRTGVGPHRLQIERKRAIRENQEYLRRKIDAEGKATAYIGTNRRGFDLLYKQLGHPNLALRANLWDGAGIEQAIADAANGSSGHSDMMVLEVSISDAKVNKQGELRWDANPDQLRVTGVFDGSQLDELKQRVSLHEEAARILNLGDTALRA